MSQTCQLAIAPETVVEVMKATADLDKHLEQQAQDSINSGNRY